MERIIRTALELGFGYAPVALALFLSFRILDIADLATDGCFVLGAAISVRMAAAGNPLLGILLAVPSGMLVGMVSAELQTRLGIPSILAGIITNTALYSVNLMVMGWRSNVNLIKEDSVFTLFRKMIPGAWSDFLLLAVFPTVIALLLRWFMSTRLGLSIRATGDNPVMVRASSIDTSSMIRAGLLISSSMTALSGAVIGQYLNKSIAGAVIGSVIYRFVYALVFYTQLVPVQCLKLLTSAVVAAAIAVPHLREERAAVSGTDAAEKEGEENA